MSNRLKEKQVKLWIKYLLGENLRSVPDELIKTYDIWLSDVNNSKMGYPSCDVSSHPAVEHCICDFFKKSIKPFTKPTVVLTHDIDYIYPTFMMWLKKAVGRRQLSLKCLTENYLDSLKRYVEIDKYYFDDKIDMPHFFLPHSASPRGIFNKIKHLVIDPSYSFSCSEGYELIDLIERENVSIGLHGSICSLDSNLVFKEKSMLEKTLNKNIVTGRQHWLNLDKFNHLEKIRSSGITLDSTLGWNGKIGFRGGFARPYPILLSNDKILWELPMLLMDGVLFDEIGLSDDDAFKVSTSWLSTLKNEGGCVALNWHGRTNSSSYGWGKSYEKILEWCRENDFAIIGVTKLLRELETYDFSRI